jgi:hypothetical protein
MKDLTFETLSSVFIEMFGPWLLGALVLIAIALTVAFLVTLVRERGLASRRLLIAQALGIAGGFASVIFVQAITRSSLGDLGGPVDVIVILGIWFAGAIGTAVGVYAITGLLGLLPRDA